VAVYYLDASAAVKAYSEERGADRVEEILNRGTELYLSRVGIVEVVATFFKKTKTGEMQVEEAIAATEDFRSDVEGVYQIIEIAPATTEKAIKIAEKHRLRAYDCLQLASALLLHRQRSVLGLEPLVLLSSDGEMNAAARDEGVAVEDPATGEAGSQPARADDAYEEQESQDGGEDEPYEAEDADPQ
jgi:uncharacterized protein